MVRGRDDVEVVGAGPGVVAAEEDGGGVEAEGVVDRVEDLRRDEGAGEEDVSTGEQPRRRRHFRSAPTSEHHTPLHSFPPFAVWFSFREYHYL